MPTEPRVVELTPEVRKRIVHNSFRLVIGPEIQRRDERGDLPDDFQLTKVQIVWRVGGDMEVRLNDETEIAAEAEIEPPVEKGERLEIPPERVKKVMPTESDPNAAHISMIRAGDGWLVGVDFRYNAARIRNHVEAAREFLGAAKRSLASRQLRAVVENLFATTELLAVATMMQVGDPSYVESHSHRYRKSQFNLWGKAGVVDRQYVELLNEVADLRSKARYPEGRFDLNYGDASTMVETAQELFDEVAANIPPRGPAPDGK